MRPSRSLVALTLLAFASLGLPDGVLGIAWPAMRREFGLEHDSLGAILAASMAGYVASSFSSGAVVARLGVARLLVASGSLVVLASAAFALAPVFPAVVVGALLFGLGAGAIDAGMNAFAAERFPPRVLQFFHAAYGAGACGGPLLVGAVVARGAGWRAGYGLLGAALLSITLAIGAARRRFTTAPPAPAGAAASPIEALRSPRVRRNVLLFFVYTGLEATAGQWTYSLWTEGRGIPPAAAALASSLFWGGLTGGRVLAGAFAGGAKSETGLRACAAVAPLAAGAIALDGGPVLGFVATLALGISLGPIYPLLVATTAARVGAALAPAAIGLQVSGACLGAAAIPAAAGALATRWAIGAAAATLFAASLVFLVLDVLVRAARSPAREASEPPPSPERAG